MLVFDRDHQGIVVRVGRIWEVLIAVRPGLLSNTWKVLSSYGYGKDVCDLEDLLRNGPITLTGTELARVIDGDSIFYDGVFKGSPMDLEFGIKDSTYLFVESNDPCVEATIRQTFSDVR